MTSPDVPPVAAEAREAAFAAWDQATVQQPGCDEATHAAWQAAWAAALQWAAQAAGHRADNLLTKPPNDTAHDRDNALIAAGMMIIASLLREGGAT